MKRIVITFILLIILLFQVSPAFCAANVDIDAASYILIDAKTGSVLYEYNPDMKWRPASTAKIMTALVALKYGNLDQMMTASTDAVNDIGAGGMNIGIMAGEQMKLTDLLHALLIVSANESANIIAENLFPTRQEFVDEMNKMAKSIGAVDCNFTNTNGVDEYERDKDIAVTARGMAIIAMECMKYPVFREIVGCKQLNSLPPTNKHAKWPILNNTSKILGKSFSYGQDPTDSSKEFTIIGIKTGSTVRAGSNYISCATNKEGRELISVIFGVKPKPGRDVFKFTENLFRAGYENYSSQVIMDRNSIIDTIVVKDASDDGKVDLVTSTIIEAVLPNDKSSWKLDKKVTIEKDVKAPLQKGTVLGQISYLDNGVVIGKSDLISTRTVDLGTKAKVKKVSDRIFSSKLFKAAVIAIIVVIAFLILRATLRRISRRRRYKLKR